LDVFYYAVNEHFAAVELIHNYTFTLPLLQYIILFLLKTMQIYKNNCTSRRICHEKN